MLPVVAIRVHLATLQVSDIVDQAIQAGWDCSKTQSYRVDVQGSSAPLAVALVRIDPPTTSCADKPDTFLVIRRRINKTDKVVVSLANLPKGMALESDPEQFNSTLPNFGLTATPQSAPGEALTTGAKRDVGQLNVAITAPDLVPAFRHVALYAKSADLFSTDERDSKSAFSGVVGVTHGVLSNWYSPFHFEENIQGNQNATSLSAVSSLGLTTLMPWHWTAKILNNCCVDIPSPPEFTLDASYTRRISQNVTAKTPRLEQNDFDINPSVTLAPIFIAPSWCNDLHNRDKKRGDPPSTSRQYCLSLETDLGMWYLPLDMTKLGSQRAEGYGDVSFLVPLSDIPFKFLGALISNNSTNSQIRIKYADSVNAANNYARTRQWTFGIEVMK
jgi:hypothetical protein